MEFLFFRYVFFFACGWELQNVMSSSFGLYIYKKGTITISTNLTSVHFFYWTNCQLINCSWFVAYDVYIFRDWLILSYITILVLPHLCGGLVLLTNDHMFLQSELLVVKKRNKRYCPVYFSKVCLTHWSTCVIRCTCRKRTLWKCHKCPCLYQVSTT